MNVMQIRNVYSSVKHLCSHEHMADYVALLLSLLVLNIKHNDSIWAFKTQIKSDTLQLLKLYILSTSLVVVHLLPIITFFIACFNYVWSAGTQSHPRIMLPKNQLFFAQNRDFVQNFV